MPIVTGNGGSMPANWCLVSFDTPAALTASNDAHQFPASEMHITAQSGSDFSVDTVTGHGAIVSAAGGFFQAGAAIGCPTSTLDAGSTALRYLWFAFIIGPDANLGQLGYDSLVPIFPAGTDNGPLSGLQTVASLPGVVPAGGAAVWNPTILLVGGTGTDSVDLASANFVPSFGNLAIWQVG